jgi:hypothetical protein
MSYSTHGGYTLDKINALSDIHRSFWKIPPYAKIRG